MTPANDALYRLNLDELEATLATMSDAELRTAAINAPLESQASAVIDGECERRGVDL